MCLPGGHGPHGFLSHGIGWHHWFIYLLGSCRNLSLSREKILYALSSSLSLRTCLRIFPSPQMGAVCWWFQRPGVLPTLHLRWGQGQLGERNLLWGGSWEGGSLGRGYTEGLWRPGGRDGVIAGSSQSHCLRVRWKTCKKSEERGQAKVMLVKPMLREGRHRPDPADPTSGTGLTRPSLFPGTLAMSREQGPQSRVGQPSPPLFLGRLCCHIWGLVVTQTCSLPEILNSNLEASDHQRLAFQLSCRGRHPSLLTLFASLASCPAWIPPVISLNMCVLLFHNILFQSLSSKLPNLH